MRRPGAMFTRKRLGLDNNVLLTMLSVTLLSLALVGYNYKLDSEKEECGSNDIFVNGMSDIAKLSFYTGDTLNFRSWFSSGSDVVWDFGDESPRVKAVRPVHAFLKEGIYRVRILVNGECPYEKKIMVKKMEPVERDTLGNIIEEIEGLDQGMVGELMSFSSPLPASSYEWSIENNRSYLRKTGDSVGYTFRAAGSYILLLVLDKERKIRKHIKISGRPQESGGEERPRILIPRELDKRVGKEPEPPAETAEVPETPEVKKAPVINYKIVSNEILKTYLQAVVCGEKTAEEFQQYLCDGNNTSVIENSKVRKQFKAFCDEIKGKKIEIISVEATRDNTICASRLLIKLDRKKGFLAKSPCK